ncbi:MAG: CvpA family protein [Eubacterium sp.]|nr:CvpA family protein [Eubacterium sp.]
MNYIDLIFIIITAVMIIAGACRGLVVSLLSMLRFIAGIPLAYFVSDTYYSQIYNNLVKDIAYNNVLEELSQAQSIETIISNVKDFTESLPSVFSGNIDFAGALSIEEISRVITDSIIEPIALVAIRIIIFAAVFVAFYVITGIIILVVKRFRKKEHAPLKKTDFILGGAFGLVKAAVFIFTAATIIGYISAIVPADNSFIEIADNSYALEFINIHNPFLS